MAELTGFGDSPVRKLAFLAIAIDSRRTDYPIALVFDVHYSRFPCHFDLSTTLIGSTVSGPIRATAPTNELPRFQAENEAVFARKC